MNKTLLFFNIWATSVYPKTVIPLYSKHCCDISRNYTKIMTGENPFCRELIDKFSDWSFNPCPKYNKLPFDVVTQNFVRMNVKNAIFSEVLPTPLKGNVRLVCSSEDAMSTILDLKPSVAEQDGFIEMLAGKNMPNGALPVAHRYGGHQFGYWAGQLGDGRANLLGEYINRAEEKWELQLKGSGPTPYSREGDGRAVLRSSIREMIASEAFHYLGIPTSRAAALIVSDDPVMRDMFYSGHPKYEKAAVVLRLAPSWFRFGSLEILTRNGETDLLKKLCNLIIKEHYPQISITDDARFLKLFNLLAQRSLELVAIWQGYGFAHGVLNTDNMSMLGLTIDFGPFGFADSYDSGYTPNHSDNQGRYSLGNQLEVVNWNLNKLAAAMVPLLSSADKNHIAYILRTLETSGKEKILKKFISKLGLQDGRVEDSDLVSKLLTMMEETGADFTITFWQLSELDADKLSNESLLEGKWALHRLSTHSSWVEWTKDYQQRILKGPGELKSAAVVEEERKKRMKAVNPRYVPRNWILQEAIEAAEKDDFSKVRFLLEIMKKPFTINEEAEEKGFGSEPPPWAYRLKLSCSS